MGRWLDGARTGAAFEFGARHHRAFSIVEISLIVARFLLPFAAVAALGFGVWWLFTAIVTLSPPWWLWAAVALLGLAVVALVVSRTGARFYGLRLWRR